MAIVVLVLLAAQQQFVTAAAASPTVVLTHGAVKVRPDAAVPSSAVVKQVAAARNEYESFQVVVSVPDGGSSAVVTSVGVSLPSALGPEAFLVHRQAYLNISVVSNCAGDPGRWPDPLIPDTDVYAKQKRNAFPVTVPSGTNQAFWVDVFVKNGTAPGLHSGTVTVQLQGSSSPISLPLDLRVHKFTLPSVSRYATTYNCDAHSILAGYFLQNVPANTTGAQRAQWQKEYVDLGLMHRVTFSDFLKADEQSLGLCGTVCLNGGDPDWSIVQQQWGDYLGWNGATVDTPYGLAKTLPTTIQLRETFTASLLSQFPAASALALLGVLVLTSYLWLFADAAALHYPGPKVGGINRTLIDELWHATGCPNPTPNWGYAYWSSQAEMGVKDMLTYCKHSAEGDAGPWAKTCGAKKGAICTEQSAPTDTRPSNNTLAIK